MELKRWGGAALALLASCSHSEGSLADLLPPLPADVSGQWIGKWRDHGRRVGGGASFDLVQDSDGRVYGQVGLFDVRGPNPHYSCLGLMDAEVLTVVPVHERRFSGVILSRFPMPGEYLATFSMSVGEQNQHMIGTAWVQGSCGPVEAYFVVEVQ